MNRFLLSFILLPSAFILSPPQALLAQHGVVREYAAFAPTPNATPLQSCLNTPLTDTSICRGPDGFFYLTGSHVQDDQASFTSTFTLWRSADLKAWSQLRVLKPGAGQYRSPEIHFFKNAFWLAYEKIHGGTELLRFQTLDLANSPFTTATITPQGITPSLFLDDDGSFFWVFGTGKIARMKPDPLEGLAESPVTIPVRIAGTPILNRQQQIERLRGAHLARINGKYHLFVTGRLKRFGLGRTGLPDGAEDVLVAASDRPNQGFSDFYVAFPHAGQTTLFTKLQGDLCATWSGSDPRAILRGFPAFFRIETVPATEPTWPIGFAAMESPSRFPFNLMLRPQTDLIYENGMGRARAVPLDIVPGQKARDPWIRDTFIMVGHDGQYYLTGTSGNMDGINLWRSSDLNHFHFVKQVWTPDPDPARWYNDEPKRLIWAPELHYFKNTYWLTFSLSTGARGKNGLLKSTSGKPEGPYQLAFPENHGVDQSIDSSLFQDSDGSIYYVWQDGKIRKLNETLSGFAGEEHKLVPTDGERVGYEGATLVKIGSWYVLTVAEWNGGGNRLDGTYDMMYSCATNLFGPYHPRRVAVPHAGHGALFKDSHGRWHASLFGNDRTAPFRAMPGYVPVEIEPSPTDILIRPATEAKN